MLLSDKDINAEILANRLVIDPFDVTLVQPASVDVRLDHRFRIFTNMSATHIDPAKLDGELGSPFEPLYGDPFVLHPGEFALACTYERFTIPPHLAARVEGKSSLGRIGLVVHLTAGFIDPGFNGQITLELTNLSNLPVLLWPGMKIAQLCLMVMSSPPEYPYGSPGLGSRYQDASGPEASKAGYFEYQRVDTYRGRA